MALSFESRTVGDLALVACRGPIVESDALSAFDRHITDLLPSQPCIVLNFDGVPFIDSAGLGRIVRLLNRARAARGDLKLCGVSPNIREVLRVTKLGTILAAYETEADAVAAFGSRRSAEEPASFVSDILCVDPSPELLTYLREVLVLAHFGVSSTTNLSDALTLLRARRPKVVVLGSALSSEGTMEALEQFRQRAAAVARVVELPPDFSGTDAGNAAKRLLARVADAMAG
jgi:anti-sigma B factor antagonist